MKEKKLILLVGLFIASITTANTLAAKLFEVGGFTMTAGIVAFPVTFLITDIINDVWGKKTAHTVVLTGLCANVLMLVLYQIGIFLPPAEVWENQEAFRLILGDVPRVVLASMLAYLVSQAWDVWLFDKIKRKWGKKLWLRNNLSTITSQLIDSAIFLGVAFGGVMPLSDMGTMLVTYLIVKGIIAIIDTPLVYLGVAWARRGLDEK